MSRGHRAGHYSSADETLAMLGIEASYFKQGAFAARAVVTAMPPYGGSGTGVLTAATPGALAAQDGVTLVTGDNVLIPVQPAGAGTTAVVAVDSGPWTVSNAGGVGIAATFTRPTWWQHAAVIGVAGDVNPPLGATVRLGPEGVFWSGTEWKSFAPKTAIIDASDPQFYPGRVTQQITLAAGSKPISNVPIRNATVSNPYNIFFTRSSWILATSTIMYESSAVSAGYIGSVLVYVFAATSIGTAAATDVSIGNVTIQNW